jgi:hypothetical protein
MPVPMKHQRSRSLILYLGRIFYEYGEGKKQRRNAAAQYNNAGRCDAQRSHVPAEQAHKTPQAAGDYDGGRILPPFIFFPLSLHHGINVTFSLGKKSTVIAPKIDNETDLVLRYFSHTRV